MTWIQTASGRAFDLLAPRAEDIDFAADIAGPLARTARFGGHVPGGAYSVAQHSVIGARCIIRDGWGRDLALHFLLHDAHEAYLGDLTRPLQLALRDAMGEAAGCMLSTPAARERAERDAAAALSSALRRLKSGLDRAIFAAAELAPPHSTHEAQIKAWDARMLETERRLFLGDCDRAWDWDDEPPTPVKWPEKARVWPWPEAADAWLDTLRDLCPAALKRKHAA
jgi:hypothetical protein